MTTFTRIASLLLFFSLALNSRSPLLAQAPHLINFQAQLADGGTLPNSLSATFSIYNQATGGSALWTEQQTVAQTNGAFSVLLGSATAFPADLFTTSGERYLQVEVNGQQAGDRFRLSSTAYALRADAADKTGPAGLTFPDGSVQTTAATSNGGGGDNDWTVTGNNMYSAVSGNVGIGTTSPSAPLHVGAGGGNFPDRNGLYVFNPTDSADEYAIAGVRVAGRNAGDPFFSLDIFGEAGWAIGVDNDDGNKLKFGRDWRGVDLSTALTITHGSGNVGIGTTTPATPLAILGNGALTPVGITQRQVGGTATMELTTADPSGNQATRLLLRGDQASDIEFYRGNRGQETRSMTILGTNGYVGIGTANPTTPLAIRGNGGTHHVGITQGHVGGGATMELTTTDQAGNQATRLLLRGSDDRTHIEFYTGQRASEELTMIIDGTQGHVGIGTATPAQKLHVDGNIIATGSIVPGSSRAFKKDIADLSIDEALAALNDLNPVSYRYKTEASGDLHLGFIAEDVPELVAIPSRKGVDPSDIVALLTKVVQQQQQRIDALEARLNDQR